MAKERTASQASATIFDEEALICAACEHVITSRAYRIEQLGAHEHTFVNPAGVVHHIGCYALAPGAMSVGAPQDAFSWFPGWSWQIALCGRCRAHLGWSYRCVDETFHGLITAALR